MKTIWNCNSKTKRIIALASIVGFVLAAAVLLSPARAPRESESPRLPTTTNGPTRTLASVTTNDLPAPEHQTCRECHSSIVANYERSGMSQSWQVATSRTELTVESAGAVKDLVSGYQYRIGLDKTGLWQEESHSEIPSHTLRRRADYQIGSGKHAIAWVTASEHGTLTQLPVGWFAEPQAWRLNPGYELKNHRFSRPVIAGCIACHATEAIHEPPSPNCFQLPIGHGIECRRCHGPANRHVEFWNSNDGAAPDANAKLFPGTGISSEQANDLCLQCHLQGDVTYYLPGRDPLHFQPGDRLLEHRHDFLIATGDADVLGVASHGARMLQSRCYIASEGRLTCILCHDPHRAANDFSREHYDSQCATCHQPQACGRRRDNENSQPIQSCVACHMPQRGTREAIHLVFTDHAIRKRPGAEMPSVPSPWKLTPDAPVNLSSCWPDTKPSHLVLGIADVLLHETMGPHEPSLQRGRQHLEAALRQNPNDAEAHFHLGTALIGLRNASTAIRHLNAALDADPQRHIARFRLALAHELAGDAPAAITAYEQLLRDVPLWLDPYGRLAQLQLARGQALRAANILSREVAAGGDDFAHAQLGLAIRLGGGSQSEALQSIQQALQLNPRSARTYLNRGAIHLLSGDRVQARYDFRHTLKLDPANVQARQALQALADGE